MNHFHIGRGTTRGALTVFPIWAEVAYPLSYSMDHTQVRIAEQADGPTVSMLSALNTAGVPLLLLEGQLLEGGMQHRMLAKTTLLAPGLATPLDVVCVEQGRWHGAEAHAARGRRASNRVRLGVHAEDGQGEVWRRVAGYDSRLGRNATSSYVEHADRAEIRVREMLRGLRPFPGQVGVLIGLAGQPLVAEIFDSPRMLARQFGGILNAAAIDAIGLPPIGTPGRRARRFMERAAHVPRGEGGRAGIAQAVIGGTEYVDVSGLRWEGHELHTLLTNPRHELVLAA